MPSPVGGPGPPLLAPGTQLGKYLLLKRLAIGGMAEIYLARASGIAGFEKLVVLKRILPQHAQHDDFIAMFLDEARIAATLHHPNIGQVYDIGEEGGSYYFTMEYIHGEDMRRVLKQCARTGKTLALNHAVHITCAVAQGLHYAHERLGSDGKPLGIVHRDVSPSNVLVTYDGQVKLVDFGIAKAASRQTETRTGTIKGKVSYMSPEQCQGKPLDRRCDVFALGILLWELSTGQRLFKGENELAVLNQIVWEDIPPPSRHRAGFPPMLERIMMRALRKRREDRFATAEELQLELESFARDSRLALSSIELSRMMVGLFGRKEEPSHALASTEDEDRAVAVTIEERTPPPHQSSAPTTPPAGPDALVLARPDTGPAVRELDSAVVAAESSLVASQRKRPWGRAIAAAVLVAAAVTVVLLLARDGEEPSATATTPPPRPGPIAASSANPNPNPNESRVPKPAPPKPAPPLAATDGPRAAGHGARDAFAFAHAFAGSATLRADSFAEPPPPAKRPVRTAKVARAKPKPKPTKPVKPAQTRPTRRNWDPDSPVLP